MSVKTKTRLRPDQAVERLAMLLCEDPSMAVPVEEIYRRYADTDARLDAMRQLAYRRGKTLPAWV